MAGGTVRSNWGFLALGIYLILVGLRAFGMFLYLDTLFGIVAFVAGVLILVEQGRK
jgi:hypothetical protein